MAVTLATSPLVLDEALRFVLPNWMLTAQPRLVADSVLHDEDLGSTSDSESTCTDSSGCRSPESSPKSHKAFDTTIVPPVRPQRRKRKRMSQEERKVRHREVQRQFMKRKRARISELRKVECGVQKQLRLVSVLAEIEQLRKENKELETQVEALPRTAPKPPMEFGNLVFSVPTQDTNEGDFELTELDWSDILDLLPEDACELLDSDVEM